jgi:methyl-accepting chemotaxis protein
MSITKKLYLSFGAILAIIAVLFLINIVAVQREHTAREATGRSLETAQSYERIRYQMMQNRLDLRNFLLSGDSGDINKLNEHVAILKQQVKATEAKVGSEVQRTALARLYEVESDWGENFAKPLIQQRRDLGARKGAGIAELSDFYRHQNAGSWISVSAQQLEDAEKDNNRLLEQHRQTDALAAKASTTVTVFGALLVIALGVIIAYRAAKSISEPLNRLIRVAREIGETGNLDHEIEIQRRDEIGELARSFSRMVDYLKEMAANSEAIAGGDLSREAAPRSKSDTLGQAFARVSAGLGTLVRSVRDSASQVASGSAQVAQASEKSAKVSVQASSAIEEVTSTMHEMSVNVQNVVKSTQVQSSNIAETSASIDQMVASIQRVADTAKVLLDISTRSREEVQNGIGSMDKATDGLNRINTSIHTSAEIIGVLGQRADDIGDIVEVIDDLAEQTNLLALNAAIEAARAGEHGLGFAVVADEVRKLAEKSAQSTKEISELIDSIQKEARKAVENMDKSTAIVNEGLVLGVELGSALKKIANVVTEVYKFAQEIGAATTEQSHGSSQIARATTRLNEITREITSAVEEQASGTHAVVRAMESMRNLVQESTSGSTELAASAEQMSKMSRNLLDVMDRFKLQPAERTERELARSNSYAAAAGARV